MMMQMLVAGGLEPLTDDIRKADSDNPKGYFEFEKAKQIKLDASWLQDAVGRVVKMVHLLLLDLPIMPGVEYGVVFMRRDLGEVVRSQAVMLQRLGKPAVGLSVEQLQQVYRQQIERVKSFVLSRGDMRLIEVEYAQVVQDPAAAARSVADFVGSSLNVESMAKAVDPNLYRNRK